MIIFSCPACGKKFSVKDELAGRRGKCKSCSGDIVVPSGNSSASEKIVIRVAETAPVKEPQKKEDSSVAGVGGDNEKIVIRIEETIPAKSSSEPITTTSSSSTSVPNNPQVTDEGANVAARQQPAKVRSTQGRRLSPRLRRLQADAEQVDKVFVDHRPIRILSREGNPPERYEIEYNVKGLQRSDQGDRPVVCKQHIVEIQLTREYPRQSPKCKMLTSVFHPNIDPSYICIGDHWTAGERLVDLVIRIGEMLSYQDFNVKSPLDGAAAMWADNNRDLFPIDNVNCFPERYDEIFNRS